ncbi:MAG: SDR family oxidoreductase [Verrucomicrobiae bacterium]|nr:SDR family oxidoreductase [Verrucomicrobiae bacterium]
MAPIDTFDRKHHSERQRDFRLESQYNGGGAIFTGTKAGLIQLVRVAALELASSGVRVNIIHPDAVFDTKLWTPEALKRSAERYGLTIEEFNTRSLMKAEITSKDVGKAAVAFASSTFLKTNGAQIPGSEIGTENSW